MIRRLLVPLFLFLCLIQNSYATISPVTGYYWTFNGNGMGSRVSSREAACAAAVAWFQAASPTRTYSCNVVGNQCVQYENGVVDGRVGCIPSGTICPPNSSGSTTCSCNEGYIEESGSCIPKPNPCPAKSGGFGWMASPVSGPSLESQTYCDNGCMVGLNAPTGSNNPGFSYTNGQQRLQKYEIVYPGAECTGGTPLPSTTEPAKTPSEPPKRPNCAPNEGVLTSSTGQVHCVPEGTPASKPPIVTKEQQTKTNADGTTTTTETTTTRDSQTGAEEKKSTSTTKDGNGNVVSVTSDTTSKGTTTGSNPDKPGDSDFCQKNPSLDICTGKLNKEETQKKVADSLSAENFDASTHLSTSLDVSTEARQKADQGKDLVLADIQKFGTAADPSSGKYAEFQDQMKGWLGEIPVSGCTPFSAKIGPYNWNFDHCEKAAKIAEIFGYCLWVMLVFGVFSLATRNRG